MACDYIYPRLPTPKGCTKGYAYGCYLGKKILWTKIIFVVAFDTWIITS